MRPISPTQCCLSDNVYKQTSSEIPEVTCTRHTIMGFLHETSLIWVISLGEKLWLVYIYIITSGRYTYAKTPTNQCKNYHINAKYMINSVNTVLLGKHHLIMHSVPDSDNPFGISKFFLSHNYRRHVI